MFLYLFYYTVTQTAPLVLWFPSQRRITANLCSLSRDFIPAFASDFFLSPSKMMIIEVFSEIAPYGLVNTFSTLHAKELKLFQSCCEDLITH